MSEMFCEIINYSTNIWIILRLSDRWFYIILMIIKVTTKYCLPF